MEGCFGKDLNPSRLFMQASKISAEECYEEQNDSEWVQRWNIVQKRICTFFFTLAIVFLLAFWYMNKLCTDFTLS